MRILVHCGQDNSFSSCMYVTYTVVLETVGVRTLQTLRGFRLKRVLNREPTSCWDTGSVRKLFESVSAKWCNLNLFNSFDSTI